MDAALTLTARMFGLPRETVTGILQVSLPLLAQKAEVNPELFKRLYAATLATLPEPIDDFYTHMAENPALRQSTMDDYKATYGAMLEAVHRETGRQLGTTDGQARDVFAALLPAVHHTLARSTANPTADTFAQQLRDWCEESIAESRSVAR